MVDASSIAISPKAPPEERRFFSKLGSQIQTAFKKLGSGIELKREIAEAERTRPELQGNKVFSEYKISAEQAARKAEWAQRKQSFMESFPAKIPGLAAAVGASIGLYVMGLSPVIYIGVLIGIILILLFIPGRRVLQFIIVLAILFVIFYFVPIFWPLAQSYAQENKGAPALKGGIASVTEFTQKMRGQLSNYVDTQIQCASGNCPRGQAEGEYVGIQLSDPQLMLPDKEYGVDEQVTVSTDVSGVNLRIYSNIKATTNCSIIKEPPISITPKTIPFADISNNKRTITCILKTVKTNIGVNTIKTSITFPFNTTSDLPVYVMDEERRNAMMEMWGRDFLSTHYKIDPDPIATFNDGPMNIGIKVNQVPIGVQKSGSKESVPAELVFALFNQWGYYNGEVVRVDDIIIELPQNMKIYKIAEENDACPFELKQSNNYVNKYELDKKDSENYTIKTVRSFVCGLEASQPEEQSFDLFTGHITITAQYTYRMTSEMQLTLKMPESNSGSSGDSGETTTFNSVESCAGYTPDLSGIPEPNRIEAYKNDDIQSGLNSAVAQYKINSLSDLDMRALLLGVMVAETGVGTDDAGDFDYPGDLSKGRRDGIPNHIAGCTCCAEPDNIQADIICAAERLNTWYNSNTCSSLQNNKYHLEKFDCMLFVYNCGEGGCGKNGDDNPVYRNTVNTYLAKWRNYLCSNAVQYT